MKDRPPPFLISDADGAYSLGVSRATFHRRVKDGTLPQPIRIHGVTRWVREELEEAVKRLKSA